MSETTITVPAAASAEELTSQLAALKQEKSQLEQKLSEANTKAHSAAINTARERVIADFKKNGIEPVLLADGEVDYKATLAKVGRSTDSNKPDLEKDDLKAQLAAMRTEIEGVKTNLTRAETEKQEKIVEVELSKAFGSLNVIDQNDAIALFRANFTVKTLEGGVVHVYKGDDVLMNAQNQPATVKEIAEKFLKDKPHLVKATARHQERGTPRQANSLTQSSDGVYRPTIDELNNFTGRAKKR